MSTLSNIAILMFVLFCKASRRDQVFQHLTEVYNAVALFQLDGLERGEFMHNPENDPVTLMSVPNDLEAAMVVSALAAHEVDATTSGSFTAGFQAEAPGDVEVLVRSCDLERARGVLSELEHEQPVVLTGEAEAEQSESTSSISFAAKAWWFVIAMFAVWLIYR